MKQHHKSYDTLRIRFTYCYRVFLWLAVILSPPSLLAQGGNKTAAEYWETYHRTDDDSTQVKLLSQLVTAYIRINPDSALLLAETAYERATTMGNEHLQAHAYVSLGKAYKRKRKVLDALSNFDQGLAIFQEQKDEEGIHRVYLERASVYMASGNPEAAIEDLNKHLTYTLQTDNDLKRAGTYHNLGKAYRQLNEPYQALENYLLARNLKDSLANVGHPEMTSREQFSTYQNLAAFYQELEQFNKARETLRQGLEFLPQEETRTYIIGLYTLGGLEERDSNYVEAQQLYQQCLEMAQASKNSVLLPYIYDGLGTVSRMQDQREIASTYYQQAFDMLGDMNNPPVLSNVLNNQARLLLDAGQTRAAKEKAKVAYTTAKASGLQVQYIDGAKLLAEIYQTEGRYQEANFYWQEYIEASETKAKEGRKQELIGLQAVMDVELNTQRYENKLQQQELALQKTFLQRLQIALAAIIVLAIALAIALWRIAVANRKLAEKNAQLADFNIQLATTNQQLSLANNKLQQFAFATGHDLKESLRNITSFAQLATIEIGENNNTARSHLQEAAAGGKRMRKMLDDLLHFSNIGGNDTVVASFPLQEIVSSVKQQLKEDIVEKQGDVHLKTPVTIKANRMAIEQLMYNLVHNGLKYQEPGRPPRISIEVDKQGEDVVFQVRDNGRGVPAADRKKIFQPFHRLLNRMESGSGLGLSICQNVVEDHGGRIWYEVGDPTGSVFCFTLPKAEPKGAFLMATT